MNPTLAARPAALASDAARPALLANPALGLAILRVATGLVFAAHGAQKVFVYGIAGTTGAFGGMGIPLAAVAAPAVAALELLGGLALVFGAFTRAAAALLAANMLGAIVLVHLKNGFFLPNGAEYAFALLGATLALAVAGPGAYSVDAARAAGRARD